MSGCHADTLLAAAQLKHKTGYTEHTLRLESAWRHLRATKEVAIQALSPTSPLTMPLLAGTPRPS
jgi:hypothetical protein